VPTLGATCPLCGGEGSRWFEANGYWIRECQDCSHRWAELERYDGHVASVYGDAYFESGGAGYPDYVGEGPLLREHGRRYASLVSAYAAPGTMLYVGCAAGFILRGFCDVGWTGVGVEPNASTARFGRENLDVEIAASAFEDYEDDRRYDLVTMIQVLPHFIDPRQALAAAAGLTKPDGLVLVETWDRRSWTARLMGRYWHEYSPPSVLHWFSRAGVRALAGGLGLVEVARGRPPKRLAASHAKSLIHHKSSGSKLKPLIALPLALVPERLTLPYPLDDVFWALFRRPAAAAEGLARVAG
jgi:SAM-dependent methyltransferase